MVYEAGIGLDCFVIGLWGKFGVEVEEERHKRGQGNVQVMKDE